jgi:hypothetical protein
MTPSSDPETEGISVEVEPVSKAGPKSSNNDLSPSDNPASGCQEPMDRYASDGWLRVGAVQVAGTLLGMFVGLSIFSIVLFAVARRFGWSKLEPTIRVDISNPQFPFLNALATGIRHGTTDINAAPSAKHQMGGSEAGTAVADFGVQGFVFQPHGRSYDQQRKAQAKERRDQEKEILQQIFNENITLRGKIPSLIPAP